MVLLSTFCSAALLARSSPDFYRATLPQQALRPNFWQMQLCRGSYCRDWVGCSWAMWQNGKYCSSWWGFRHCTRSSPWAIVWQTLVKDLSPFIFSFSYFLSKHYFNHPCTIHGSLNLHSKLYVWWRGTCASSSLCRDPTTKPRFKHSIQHYNDTFIKIHNMIQSGYPTS